MSKGSKRRPPRVREEVIERNWRRTFSKGVLRYVNRKVAKEANLTSGTDWCLHFMQRPEDKDKP